MERRPSRRRFALGVAALALLPIGLSACGNAAKQQMEDTRPEPNASTEGVRQVFPSTPDLPTVAPTVTPIAPTKLPSPLTTP